jgi:hypothetical protein
LTGQFAALKRYRGTTVSGEHFEAMVGYYRGDPAEARLSGDPLQPGQCARGQRGLEKQAVARRKFRLQIIGAEPMCPMAEPYRQGSGAIGYFP